MRVFLFTLCLGLGLSTFAQQLPPSLYINATNPNSSFVEIEYDINYGGFIELHLIDESGKKVWIHGVVNDKLGTYKLRIPTKPLKSGERYSFYLRYKGKKYDSSFYAP